MNEVIAFYDKLICQLSEEKEEIMNSMEYLGLNKHEVTFMKLIEEGRTNEIKGSLINKVKFNINH